MCSWFKPLPTLQVSALMTVSFGIQKPLSFMRFHLLIDGLSACAKHILFRKSSPVQRSTIIFQTFSSSKFIVSSFPRCEIRGILIHYWWVYKLIVPLWKSVWQFLRKMNQYTSRSTYSTIGIYLKILHPNTEICVALCIISRI